jgi:hypothetical protein
VVIAHEIGVRSRPCLFGAFAAVPLPDRPFGGHDRRLPGLLGPSMCVATHGPEHPATAFPCHVRDGRDDAPYWQAMRWIVGYYSSIVEYLKIILLNATIKRECCVVT